MTTISFGVLLLVISGRFGDEKVAGKISLIAVLLLLIAIYGRAALDVKSITVNHSEQILVFRDPLIKSTKSFPFNYFDGYTECRNYNALYGVHYELYLVKDQKIIYIFSSAYYSNYTDY